MLVQDTSHKIFVSFYSPHARYESDRQDSSELKQHVIEVWSNNSPEEFFCDVLVPFGLDRSSRMNTHTNKRSMHQSILSFYHPKGWNLCYNPRRSQP